MKFYFSILVFEKQKLKFGRESENFPISRNSKCIVDETESLVGKAHIFLFSQSEIFYPHKIGTFRRESPKLRSDKIENFGREANQ